MKIANNLRIADLQQEFSQQFPWLRLEFYKGPREKGVMSPPHLKASPDTLVGEIRTLTNEGEIIPDGRQSVAEFENALWEQFGLHAQVFRRSGNLWLQTCATDHWSLDEQNGKGQRSEISYQQMHGDEK